MKEKLYQLNVTINGRTWTVVDDPVHIGEWLVRMFQRRMPWTSYELIQINGFYEWTD